MSTDQFPAGTDQDFLTTVRSEIEDLSESASVQRVFGEPITAEGKTVVPVARVAYGFGSGYGSGTTDAEDTTETDGESGAGGGVGGGLSVKPVGVLEVTADDTRFVRIDDWKRTAIAVGIGLVLGLLVGRR